MRNIERQKKVSYSPAKLFNLVRDVPSYPEFIPWCPKGEVRSHIGDEVVATVHMRKGPVSQSFTTKNHLEPHHTITMNLVEGPFKALVGRWRFDHTDDGGCLVKFDMQFEFSNPLFDVMAGNMLEDMASGMVDCFCQRAEALYGNQHAQS